MPVGLQGGAVRSLPVEALLGVSRSPHPVPDVHGCADVGLTQIRVETPAGAARVLCICSATCNRRLHYLATARARLLSADLNCCLAPLQLRGLSF